MEAALQKCFEHYLLKILDNLLENIWDKDQLPRLVDVENLQVHGLSKHFAWPQF